MKTSRTPLIYQDVKDRNEKQGWQICSDRFQIVGKKDLFPAQLSGGQQQLVGIARALIAETQALAGR
jgi:ABC-type methionine transport system ATPase subunit